jgi:negative regulator of sigma E activity
MNDTANNDEDFEVLSALIDGERVEPESVDCALARPGGASFLVDCVRLRETLRDEARPHPTFTRNTSKRLGLSPTPRHWLVAAGLAAALVAAVLWLARPAPRPAVETMPEPDRVIRLVPGRDWIG